MLAGSWQFPPLPSLAMLIMQYLEQLVHIGADRLYVTFFQACVVWQLIMLCGWRRCWCVLLPLFLPAVFKNLCVLEAGWLAAALFTAGLCAFVRWQEGHSLREAQEILTASGEKKNAAKQAALTLKKLFEAE